MALMKVTGIVMRYANYKDYDRMLTIFTLQNGKISALARGARRPKSALLNATEQFCMAEFVLMQNKDRYTVTSSSILDSFYNIRVDINSYYAASYFSAVCQTLIQEEQPDEKLYSIFAKMLAYMAHSESSALANLIIALCTVLDISGFKPDMNYCVKCKCDLSTSDIFYDNETGYFTCSDCKKPQNKKMSLSSYKALNYIFMHKENAFAKVNMEDWLIKEMLIYLTNYIEIKLDKNLKQTGLLLSIL